VLGHPDYKLTCMLDHAAMVTVHTERWVSPLLQSLPAVTTSPPAALFSTHPTRLSRCKMLATRLTQRVGRSHPDLRHAPSSGWLPSKRCAGVCVRVRCAMLCWRTQVWCV
jgi:hypothetical protein